MGYATLGAVIEAVTGDTGSSHIERALFEPLGMRASAASPERRGGLQLAQAYTWRLGRRGAVPA